MDLLGLIDSYFTAMPLMYTKMRPEIIGLFGQITSQCQSAYHECLQTRTNFHSIWRLKAKLPQEIYAFSLKCRTFISEKYILIKQILHDFYFRFREMKVTNMEVKTKIARKYFYFFFCLIKRMSMMMEEQRAPADSFQDILPIKSLLQDFTSIPPKA